MDKIAEMCIKSRISSLNDDYDACLIVQNYLWECKSWNAYYEVRAVMDKIDDKIDKLNELLKN